MDIKLEFDDELEKMFGYDVNNQNEIESNNKIALNKEMEGFASCFPDWDLHPPKL